MTIRAIIRHPDARLYSTCKPFKFETGRADMMDLRDTYRKYYPNAAQGKVWGLAFPQIGVLKAGFIMHIEGVETFVLNPVPQQFSAETIAIEEQSLSVPGLKTGVLRHMGIKGMFFTGVGQPAEFHIEGMPARVFQQLFEHLIGVTIATHKHRDAKVAPDAVEYMRPN